MYGEGRAHLSFDHLRSTSIVLPPISEQREIVQRVHELFDYTDRLERLVDAMLKRSSKVSQSILAKAFRGELVPTEAELARQEGRDYEPASVLLKRIRAESAKQEAEQQKRRTRKVPKKKTTKARRPLREVLTEAARQLTPEQLFAEAGFTAEYIEAFYEELRAGVEDAQIREVRPNDTEVYLEAATP